MFFDRIIYGTQYYRAPTPLPNEWEEDIARFEALGLDAFQIRINWRWNEIREGEYVFDDVDRLMDLAVKYNRKVIIKFLLECAPQYVFDKYGGTRIGPKGEQLRGGCHGAFYGGWRPCFTNPGVQNAARKFVEVVAERYANHPNLILWNAWNEIRNKPIEDCFCPHCRNEFGKYLKNKFGTVEALNAFYGAAEDSFETIALPATPHGYWDTYEFKLFRGGNNLYDYLRFVYDGIRKYDKVHPVMSHVGFTAAFQASLGDICDDYTVSRAVDFWGTSIPCSTLMGTQNQRFNFMMLNDFLRSVDKNYFVHEVYPGIGMFKGEYDTPYDMDYKLYTALASGAKGLVYWQYRAERVGHEADCAGLVRADGSKREVADAAARFGEELHRNMRYLQGCEAVSGEAAIVFDFNASLISEIDDSCGADFSFESYNPLYYYRLSHAGMYRALREMNYNVDYVGATEPEKWSQYKLLYFPYQAILRDEMVPWLVSFVEQGGIVLADEGFGLRSANTWMNPYDIPLGGMAQIRMRERRLSHNEHISVNDERVPVRPFKTEYAVKDGQTLLAFDDGAPALQKITFGKGTFYLFGFSLGYSLHDARPASLCDLLRGILGSCRIAAYRYADGSKGIFEKHTRSDNYKIVYLFNNSNEHLRIDDHAVAVGGFLQKDGDGWALPPQSMGYFVQNI